MAELNLGKVVGSDAKINGQTAITLTGANGVSVITSGTDVTVDGAGIKTELTTHTSNTDIHVTAEEKAAWNAVNYSNPNLLDNSDFRINQRGKSEYISGNAGCATVDRWGIREIGNELYVANDGVQPIIGDTANKVDLSQTFPQETIDKIIGKVCTLSISISGTTIKTAPFTWGTNTQSILYDPEIGIQIYCGGASPAYSNMCLRCRKDGIKINWVKLELGSIATPFCPPNPTLELIKCGIPDDTSPYGYRLPDVYNTDRFYKLFGFELDQTDSNPATCIRYIGDNRKYDSAYMDYDNNVFNYGDWADAWFIKKIKPVMMNYDGTVAYELNPNDYTKKADGTASDVANPDFAGNVMIGIPTVWYYIDTTNPNKPKFWFSDTQVNPDFHAYAHTDENGNIIPYTYMNAYDGWVDSNGKMRSISGKIPTRTQAASVQMTESRANNLSDSNIWDMQTLSDRILIQLLLLLIGKSTDTQSVFGYGNGSGYYSHATGSDENGVLPAGTLNDKGLFFGYSSETNLAVKVFGIENFYGNIWKRCHGLIVDNGNMKVKMTRNTLDGSTATDYNLTGEGYVSIGETPSGTSGGFISTMAFNQYGLFPTNASGSDSTYYCDALWFDNAIVSVALFSGGSDDGSRVGALACILYNSASYPHWSIGCGLSCKP